MTEIISLLPNQEIKGTHYLKLSNGKVASAKYLEEENKTLRIALAEARAFLDENKTPASVIKRIDMMLGDKTDEPQS